jgi:hypothetical protein
MYSTHILKTSAQNVLSMSPEPEGKLGAREPVKEEEPTDARAKALSYALLNRPSPPF